MALAANIFFFAFLSPMFAERETQNNPPKKDEKGRKASEIGAATKTLAHTATERDREQQRATERNREKQKREESEMKRRKKHENRKHKKGGTTLSGNVSSAACTI